MAVQPTHLCIISRDPLRAGRFGAALRTSLGPEDYLEIIMDRRHGRSSGESDLKEDRRRQPQVDLALDTDGFALVPASVSLHRPEAPIERSPVDDEDEARLESSENFERPQSSTLIPKLLGVLSGVMLAALVWLLAEHVTGQSLRNQLFTGPLSGGPDQPPGHTNEAVIAETRPARTEAAPPASSNSKSPSASRTASGHETKGPSEISTSTRGASAPGASGGGPKLGATARLSSNAPPLSNRVAGALPAGTATPKPTPEQVVGHRAELVREPVSRGWGDSYAVRLLDPAGQPMVATDVFLVARMADGTIEKVAMGALPERGTYRGTVPTGRSTPVDLRVRMTTGDESLDVPVRPSREKK